MSSQINTPTNHRDEGKIRVVPPPHPTPSGYATYHTRDSFLFTKPFTYSLHYCEWYSGGLIQSWKTKDQFGKCRSYGAMVRRDGKIFGKPDDEGPAECTTWDHYATVTPDGYLNGISTDGYQYVPPTPKP